MIVTNLKKKNNNRLSPESFGRERFSFPALYGKKILTGKLINYPLAALFKPKNSPRMNNKN